MARPCEAEAKVTQAALCDFKGNSATVLAIEDFGKPMSLVFLNSDRKIVYSTTFTGGFNSHEFAYTNPFLRFRSYKLRGLPSPIVVAVGVYPGGSDVGYEVKLIAEKSGKITSLLAKPIDLTIQDGFYLGGINVKSGSGLIVWKNVWENEAHYGPHRYEIRVYTWDSHAMNFRLVRNFKTSVKYKDGCAALSSYQLPCKNYRDDVVPTEQEISTLGIESEFFTEENKNN
jgi:hypothetical protein